MTTPKADHGVGTKVTMHNDEGGWRIFTDDRIINVGLACSVRRKKDALSFMYQNHGEHLHGAEANEAWHLIRRTNHDAN